MLTIENSQSALSSVCALEIPAMGLGLRIRLQSSPPTSEVTVLEIVYAPGYGPPLHRHSQAETFRVLEGEYLYEVDGRRFYAKAGDLIVVPGGAAHAFVNTSNRPSGQLVLMRPALDAVGFLSGLRLLLASGRSERADLNAFGARWGVEFLGPPIQPERAGEKLNSMACADIGSDTIGSF
jgi:quercetin dioxygenase-like cupin family protein